MPFANQDFTFYQIPLPHSYRTLPRRTRVIAELSAGLAFLVLFGLAASGQTPRWLQVAGWLCLVLYWATAVILYLRRWGQRQARARHPDR